MALRSQPVDAEGAASRNPKGSEIPRLAPGLRVAPRWGAARELTIDDRIAAEYREVLARPKFALEPSRLGAFLAIVPFQHRITAAKWPHKAPPDPDDLIFLEAALQATDRVLVTGNLRHYPRGCRGPVSILDPREAWQRLTP